MRNGEYYRDPTASTAIGRVRRRVRVLHEKELAVMDLNRQKVRVVLCKDCRFFTVYGGAVGHCDTLDIPCYEDFYCKCGKRFEGGQP